MLAHWHGQIWNASAFGRAFGVADTTVRRYRVTPSMRSALRDLRLDTLDIVHAGSDSFSLAERVRALALRRIVDDLKPLR